MNPLIVQATIKRDKHKPRFIVPSSQVLIGVSFTPASDGVEMISLGFPFSFSGPPATYTRPPLNTRSIRVFVKAL